MQGGGWGATHTKGEGPESEPNKTRTHTIHTPTQYRVMDPPPHPPPRPCARHTSQQPPAAPTAGRLQPGAPRATAPLPVVSTGHPRLPQRRAPVPCPRRHGCAATAPSRQERGGGGEPRPWGMDGSGHRQLRGVSKWIGGWRGVAHVARRQPGAGSREAGACGASCMSGCRACMRWRAPCRVEQSRG